MPKPISLDKLKERLEAIIDSLDAEQAAEAFNVLVPEYVEFNENTGELTLYDADENYP